MFRKDKHLFENCIPTTFKEKLIKERTGHVGYYRGGINIAETSSWFSL